MIPLLRSVGPGFFVAGQIGVQDIRELAEKGFRTIVNNRPDGEGGPSQPLGLELEAEARRHGLAYVHLPVEGTHLDARSAQALAQVLAQQPSPVLAFCRTGRRSEALYRAAHG